MRSTIRRSTTLLAAATLAFGLAACAEDDPVMEEPTGEPTDEATDDDADDDADAAEADDGGAGGDVVAMTFFNFAPDVLTVPVGTTVTWVNEDTVLHTATADDGSFDVETPGEGDEGSHTFDEAGEFTYFCEVHASMTATITVE